MQNQLLEALSPDARRDAETALERVRLPLRTTIYEAGGRIEYVYFPIDAVAAITTLMRDGAQIEVFTIGREGMTGAQTLLDDDRSLQLTACQVAGDALRMRLDRFRQLSARHTSLRSITERYLSAQFDAMAQTIACTRLHYVSERCARLLLVAHDRYGRDEFSLTHEGLALMLGVRRAGVSVAAAALQRAGYIRYSRGRFTIVDRPGLETAACECYAAIADGFAQRRSLAG